MKLETYAKIGIIFGITALVVGLFLMVVVHTHHIREEIGHWFVDQEGLINEFKNSEPYFIFIEMYPVHVEEIETRNDGSVRVEISAFSIETGNQLELRYYFEHEERERVNARCDQHNNNYRTQLGTNSAFEEASKDPNFQSKVPLVMYKDGGVNKAELVVDFIKYTNCLDLVHPKGHGNNQ